MNLQSQRRVLAAFALIGLAVSAAAAQSTGFDAAYSSAAARSGRGSSSPAQVADPQRAKRDASSAADARAIGKALEQEKNAEDLAPGGVLSASGKTSADGRPLHVGDFRPASHLKMFAVPAAAAGSPPGEETGAAEPASYPLLDASWERSKHGATSVLGIGGGLVGAGGGLLLINGGMVLCAGGLTCAAGAPAIAIGTYLAVRGTFGAYLNAKNLATGKEGPSSMLEYAADSLWPGSVRAQHVVKGVDLVTDLTLITAGPGLLNAGKELAVHVPLWVSYTVYMGKESASLGKTAEVVGWSDSIVGIGDSFYKHFRRNVETSKPRPDAAKAPPQAAPAAH